MSNIQALVSSLKFEEDVRGRRVLTATLPREPRKFLGLELPVKPLRLQFTDDQVLKGQFSQITFPSQEAEDYFTRIAGEMVLRRQGLNCS